MRHTVRRWHARLAIASCLLMAIVAITGVLLSFRAELRTPEPEATGVAAGPMMTLDEAVARAQGHAGLSVAPTEIYIADGPGGTWCVVLGDDAGTEVYMAADGALVEVLVPEPGLVRWLFELHTGEILGDSGRWVSAAVGVILLWLALSGLWIEVRMWMRKARTR